MKIAIIDESYPHHGNVPGNMFVHVRVKKYIERHEVRVISFESKLASLQYDGVQVDLVNDPRDVPRLIRDFNPDRIVIHVFQTWMLETLIHKFNVPFIIWSHGYEVTGWYRRLFNQKSWGKALLINVWLNTKQQLHFRKLILESNRSKRVRFVFVSQWLKRIAALDTLTSIRYCCVIPNPIDTDLFSYQPKPAEQRFHVLLLRSFQSRKYANDISVKAILLMSKHPLFHKFHFTIMGKGELFWPLVKPLQAFPNVKIKEGVLPHEEIPLLHKENGIFLCPTRQDTHGVSMCEAMSSGLVPIASSNSAIPEYVEDNVSGLLTRNVRGVAQAMIRCAQDESLFQTLSKGASEAVRRKCDIHEVIEKELRFIESVEFNAEEKVQGSEEYWKNRYAQGGNSGAGSYDRFANFKAEVINQFVMEKHISDAIEFGSGDGNQLSLCKYPNYIGFDVSPDAISNCRKKFSQDSTKKFKLMSEYEGEKADVTLSLDVIYHLIEDEVFVEYMERLFSSSNKYVVIYSSNTDSNKDAGPHERNRKIEKWIEAKYPKWILIRHIPNRYPLNDVHRDGSPAEFFVYEKKA